MRPSVRSVLACARPRRATGHVRGSWSSNAPIAALRERPGSSSDVARQCATSASAKPPFHAPSLALSLGPAISTYLRARIERRR
jgi:hypothetical protein